MAHVLIGFAEALPAPEVVFSLLAAGHRVSAFARRPDLPLKHLPLERLALLPAPEADPEATIVALRRLMAGDEAPEVILPLDDAGLWLVNAALGGDPRLAGATGEQARIALDKAAQITAAQAAGLAVPPTTVARAPADLDRHGDLPAIAKPALAVRVRDGRLGKGEATYLSDKTALQSLRQGLDADMEPLLVQPLIAGTGEGIFGYATPEGVVGWSAHRRLRMMNPHGSGSSACASCPVSEDMRAKVSTFLQTIDWRGPFMIEMLRDPDGTAWFMELNGRMWGSLALARRLGLEYPAWAVAGALDPGFVPDPPELPQGMVVQRNLGRDILHLLFVVRGPKSDFHRTGWPSFARSLIGVLKPAHPRAFYNYDPNHPGFFLRDALWTIRKALTR